jgi:hypothetical protein
MEYLIVNKTSGMVHGPMPADRAAEMAGRLMGSGNAVMRVLHEPGGVFKVPTPSDRLVR